VTDSQKDEAVIHINMGIQILLTSDTMHFYQSRLFSRCIM